ncbi:MAG: PIN domain-containing protein [Dolichospermum sp. BR01]|nr:PIN domain-containing protein [Dolichospermum sp. BR01]
MQTLFADTFYWVALIHAKDQWHKKVRSYSVSIKDYSLVTTDLVLVEYLNFFGKSDQYLKKGVVNFYQQIQAAPNVEITAVDSSLIESGVKLYANRLDKGYSLTDCISMIVMQQLGICEILTHDKHFTQEGFNIIFQDI